MSEHTAALRPAARNDVIEAAAWYAEQGGVPLELRFVDAVSDALEHIARFPASGSPRYAPIVKMDGLRVWPLKRFPHLVFYIERGERIDVWRVLHGERDIAAWLHEGE